MLVNGLNDTPEALTALARVLHRIAPDEIHLMTPTRPPAEPWVEPPDRSVVSHAVEVFERIAKVIVPGDSNTDFDLEGELDRALIDIVTRHPMREDEVRSMVERQVRTRTDAILSELADGERIQVVNRLGDRFWCAADSDFGDHRSTEGITPTTGVPA
jgi:wyosine [tRNA(Phe)-imidazoG37] synthetase (radical SAM superfamily)